MRNVTLMESMLIQTTKVAFGQLGAYVDDADIIKTSFEVTFEAASDFLRMVKSKQKTALLFNDIKGNMIAAAVVDYNENEEEGQPNYNYYWTFDKSDVEGEEVKKYESNQEQVKELFLRRCSEGHSYQLSVNYAASLPCTCLSCLSDYLTENAKEEDEFTITHEGFFTASSVVEDGVIVKSLLPGAAMKMLIKDDVTVEA